MDDQKMPHEYFTKDVNARLSSMTEQEMYDLLISLEGTDLWYAILKYNQMRMSVAQSSIFSTDPVVNPTLISRNQGIMLGLSDLQNAVITMHFDKMDEANKTETA